MSSRALGTIFVVLLCDLISFAILLPLLPNVIAQYHKADGGDGLFSSMLEWAHWFRPYLSYVSRDVEHPGEADIVLMGGLLGSLGAVLQLITSVTVGRLADRHGRRPLVLLCELGTLLSLVAWLFADQFPLFVASRFFSGISRGLTQLSHTIASDVSTSLGRTRAMAMIGAAFSLGFVFGPLLGALLMPAAASRALPAPLFALSERVCAATGNPFGFAALVSLAVAALGALIAAVALPETRPAFVKAVEKPKATDAARPHGDAERLLQLTHCVFLALFAGFEYNLTFFLSDQYGFSTMDNGKLLALIGVVAVVLQGSYVRRFKQMQEVKTICGSGIIALLVSLLLFAHGKSTVWIVAASVIFGYASAVVVPTLTSLVSIVASESERGASIGAFRAYGLVGRAAGPLLCSFLYWSFGPTVAFMTLACLLVVPMMTLDVAARHFNPEELRAKED